ncbi:efflux RND transporter periplasmic adaptor subunit [bacterium]|nr:efflux RND transporter periplasmic adaptor subunit [bacterium]
MVRTVGILLLLVLLTVVAWLLLNPEPEVIQGEVEATQIDVSAKIPGRVDSILVREGDRVGPGQLLVVLESPEIRAKLKQAAAAARAASAQSEKADRGAREEEVRQARSVWQRATHGAELAEKTFGRIENLHRDGVVPEQRRDEAEAQWKAAHDAAEAARAVYDQALAGARSEDRKAASALAEQAGGAVAEVEAFLEETRLHAPIGGEIVELVVDPGELVSAGFPIVTIVDLRDSWITFHLREDRLSGLRIGDTLRAGFPALGGKQIDLRVSYISAMGDFATWRATNALGGFDLKTFEVRARPVQPIDRLRPGMSAIVAWD